MYSSIWRNGCNGTKDNKNMYVGACMLIKSKAALINLFLNRIKISCCRFMFSGFRVQRNFLTSFLWYIHICRTSLIIIRRWNHDWEGLGNVPGVGPADVLKGLWWSSGNLEKMSTTLGNYGGAVQNTTPGIIPPTVSEIALGADPGVIPDAVPSVAPRVIPKDILGAATNISHTRMEKCISR